MATKFLKSIATEMSDPDLDTVTGGLGVATVYYLFEQGGTSYRGEDKRDETSETANGTLDNRR